MNYLYYVRKFFGKQVDWLMEHIEGSKYMYESFFLSKSIIGEFFEWDKDDLKERLEGAKQFFDIPVKDVDDFLHQLRDPDFLNLEHDSPWEFSTVPVLNYTGEVRDFGCCRAKFDITNKWGHKQPYCYDQILYNDDFLVSWIGDVLTNMPVFWLSIDAAVYRFVYSHKRIEFSTAICREPVSIKGLEPETLDNVVKKQYKHLGSSVFDYANSRNIELDSYFRPGFFYRGPKWNMTEYDNGYPEAGKKNISGINGIQAENGLFRIRIENQTYPRFGYVYLDLKNLEITYTEEEKDE